MNFKLVSKNNVGFVLTLLLIIFLSQSKILNFLMDTYLGRIILVSLLLVVSYCNKILGVVFVLIVVISFNLNLSSFEGFETGMQEESTFIGPVEEQHSTTESQVSVPKTPTESPVMSQQSAANDDSLVTKSIEGFDMIGTENNIKRGKQSNSIPVNKISKTSATIAPVDSASLFKENYSNF